MRMMFKGNPHINNTVWKLSALLLGGGAMFLFNLALMRVLGPSSYGLWAFSMSWSGLFAIVIDFGFNPLISRDIPRDPHLGRSYFRHILKSKGILMLMAGIGLMGITPLQDEARHNWGLIVLAFLVLASTSVFEMGQVFTHAYQRFRTGFVMSMVFRVSMAAAGLCALAMTPSVPLIMTAALAAGMAGAAYSMHQLNQQILPRVSPARTIHWRELWLTGWPLFIQNVFIVIYAKIGTVMLASFQGLTETGVYNAAFRFFELSNLLPTALLAAVVAPMSVQLKTGAGFRWLVKLGMIFLSAAIAGILILSGITYALQLGWLGDGYAESPGVLQVLSWALLFYYPNFLWTTALVHLHRLKAAVVISGTALVANTGLNYWAIPKWGAIGAAWATVATEAVITLGCLAVIVACARSQKY